MAFGAGTTRPNPNWTHEQLMAWLVVNWPYKATTGAKMLTANEIADGAITGTVIAPAAISTSHLDFTIEGSTIGTNNIVATINASIEGLQISAAKIAISGLTTFASGYDPTSKLGVGDAAADVNAGTTTINGSKITTGTITADMINVTDLSAISANLGNITSGGIINVNGVSTDSISLGGIYMNQDDLMAIKLHCLGHI